MDSSLSVGCTLAKRIALQILAASRKINKGITSFNLFAALAECASITRDMATALDDNECYEGIDIPHERGDNVAIPTTVKRKAIDLFSHHERAVEEMVLVRRDRRLCLAAVARRCGVISTHLKTHSVFPGGSRYDLGCGVLLQGKLQSLVPVQSALENGVIFYQHEVPRRPTIPAIDTLIVEGTPAEHEGGADTHPENLELEPDDELDNDPDEDERQRILEYGSD